MTLRVAINGYGRIGRNVLRAFFESGTHPGLEFVAINDLGQAEALAHLTRYDSTHGRFGGEVVLAGNALRINGQELQLFNEPLPENLPWAALGIDVVLECSGQFRARAEAARHLAAGAKKVIIGAAPFDDVDATLVYGVNHESVRAQDRIISSVSCTTQALAVLVKLLDDAFGVESGLMTEIHAVTSDQVVLDHTHRDLRRARAAGNNIIPTTSSSIGALRRVLPEVGQRIEGYSLRVPTQNVAAVDFNFVGREAMSVAAINRLFAERAAASTDGVLGYCDELLVSSDFNHSPYSLIFDATETRIVGRQAKVLVWYDNEWGYANRLLDLCSYLSRRG
ncbi:MAG: type I glyceraldehyde-3-phosphate dehydrogenase [Moraxellaceae bacterium]|nr:type I glyceraldehyde-3-phosphate dehydrogenase [Moraxellaceae bacterium]